MKPDGLLYIQIFTTYVMSTSPKKFTAPSTHDGFTLLELIAVILIVGSTLAWALPQFSRQITQSSVDHFTQALVSGLYSLRARQGADLSGCEINFNSNYVFTKSESYGTPKDLFELNHLTTEARANRLKCCDSAQCWNEVYQSTWQKPYRFLDVENIASSKNVEIQVSTDHYSLSPPGTSSMAEPLKIILRAKNWDQDPQRPLPTLCVELSANGVIRRGVWNKDEKQCRDL